MPKSYNFDQDEPHKLIAVALCHEPTSAASDRSAAQDQMSNMQLSTHDKCSDQSTHPKGNHDRSFSDEIKDLRMRCPLPVLMTRMGYVKFAKRTCSSPFRTDKRPSWGIFQRNDRWFWKDHGSGDSGDEIEFIVKAKKLSPNESFTKAIGIWHRMAEKKSKPDEVEALRGLDQQPREKPDRSGFGPGSDTQLERLCKCRRIDPVGVVLAQMHDVLVS